MDLTATLSGPQGLSASLSGKRYSIYSGSSIRLSEVTLLASAWTGTSSPYSQVVAIDGVTSNTKVDLQPSVEQLETWHEKDLAFTTENNDGVITVYAIGDKPANDYTVQVTLMEVAA